MIDYSELLICRVCECDNNALLNIYQISNVHIINNLQELTCKSVEDKLPKFICCVCNSKLTAALEFKKQCLNTEKKLKLKIENQLEELKYEIKYLEEGHVEDGETIKSDDLEDIFEDIKTKKPQIKQQVKIEGIPKIIQCPRCKNLFNNLEESLLHYKNKCKELYHCEECPKIFASKYLFDRHCKMIHPVENPLECKICSKIFKNTSSLRCHKKYVHLKEQKQFCDICGKGFVDITGLRYHKETHKPKGETRIHNRYAKSKNKKPMYKKFEIPRVCEICGLQFSTYQYYSHIKMKHSEHIKRTSVRPSVSAPIPPKILKCDLCNVTCRTTAQVNTHKRVVHTNERPYKCNQCSSAFKLSRHLQAHIKSVHLGEKRYKCSICEKELNDRGNYEVHMRKHEGIKPFECHYCSESFYGRRLLKKHTEKHHPEEKDKEGNL